MDLTELNLPEKEGHDYGYSVFELLPDINISSNRSTPVPVATITSMNAKTIILQWLTTIQVMKFI